MLGWGGVDWTEGVAVGFGLEPDYALGSCGRIRRIQKRGKRRGAFCSALRKSYRRQA